MSLQPATMDRIWQAKMDALCARNVHTGRLNRLRKCILLKEGVALVLPIVFFTVVMISDQNATAQRTMRAVGIVLSSLLLILGIVKVLGQWEDKVRAHIKGVSENIVLKNEADTVLSDPGSTEERAEYFLRLAETVEKPDSEVLANRSENERKRAYRDALKEIRPGDPSPTCPKCGANPWSFKKGSCGLCGNTPAKEG